MIWAIWNEWNSGVQFTFHCYLHWETLVVQDSEGLYQFFHSKEGVTQGDPVAMITYCIRVLPIIG